MSLPDCHQVLGYYNRRGINPEAFLNEIKYIASDPDDKHFFKVTDESALKDIVDALGDRIFSLEGIPCNSVKQPSVNHKLDPTHFLFLYSKKIIPPAELTWSSSTGTSKNGTAFGLQMSQAGFSSHFVEVSLTTAAGIPPTHTRTALSPTPDRFPPPHPIPPLPHSPGSWGACCDAEVILIKEPLTDDSHCSTLTFQRWK